MLRARGRTYRRVAQLAADWTLDQDGKPLIFDIDVDGGLRLVIGWFPRKVTVPVLETTTTKESPTLHTLTSLITIDGIPFLTGPMSLPQHHMLCSESTAANIFMSQEA